MGRVYRLAIHHLRIHGRHSLGRAALLLAMKEISLTKDLVAFVDDEDFEALSRFKWYEDNGYAVRKPPMENGIRGCNLRMHCEILGRFLVDHIDGNGLNNQRHNLRPATVSQNGANRRKHRFGLSQFKGVCWHKRDKKWLAYIQVARKRMHIGSFDSELDAAKAYNFAATAAFGEFACLNAI